VAGLRADGIVAPMVFDGAMDGLIFRHYIETQLGPTLRPGDVVVMDNLAAHKVSGIRAAIEARGANLLYLPAYSPAPNPIELLFSKLKHLLRSAAARTVGALRTLLAPALTASRPTTAAITSATQATHPA
jgi:transposase